MTLPWIVALAAILYLVLWQSGLFNRSPRVRRDPQPRQLKGKADPNRLKVFEDFLQDLQQDKGQDPESDEPPGKV